MERAEGYFRSFDHHELFWQVWKNPKNLGTLVVVHGLGEHSECYSRLAEGISSSGFTIAAFDLRGHGRSWGQRGVVRSFDDYVHDLNDALREIKKHLPQKPMILLGHSMGGLVVVRYLLKKGAGDLSAAVLSSPLLGLSVQIPGLKRVAAEMVAKIAPSFTLYNELPFRIVTRDPKVVFEYERDPLRHDRISAPLYLEMLRSAKEAIDEADSLRIPFLVQQAGREQVVSKRDTEKFFANVGSSDKKLIIYDRLLHEVYNEVGREEPYKDLCEFLNRWV